MSANKTPPWPAEGFSLVSAFLVVLDSPQSIRDGSEEELRGIFLRKLKGSPWSELRYVSQEQLEIITAMGVS